MRNAIIASCAAVAVLLGLLSPVSLALMLAVLPLAAGALCAMKVKWAAAGLPAALCACAAFTLPWWCLPPAVILCALCGLTAVSGAGCGRDLGRAQLRAALLAVLSAAIVLRLYFSTIDVSDLLAGRVITALENWSGCNDFLVLMMQYGFLSGSGSAGAGFTIGRLTVLLPAEKQEMLLQLRGTLVPVFRSTLCAVCALWPVLTGLLTASVTDWIGEKQTGKRSMPRFAQWQLSPTASRLLCIAVLVVCVPDYGTQSGLGIFMMIAEYALIGLCCVLGTSILCGLLGRRGGGLFFLSCLLGVTASLFTTTAMPLFVMLDAAFDFRRIRPGVPSGE